MDGMLRLGLTITGTGSALDADLVGNSDFDTPAKQGGVYPPAQGRRHAWSIATPRFTRPRSQIR